MGPPPPSRYAPPTTTTPPTTLRQRTLPADLVNSHHHFESWPQSAAHTDPRRSVYDSRAGTAPRVCQRRRALWRTAGLRMPCPDSSVALAARRALRSARAMAPHARLDARRAPPPTALVLISTPWPFWQGLSVTSMIRVSPEYIPDITKEVHIANSACLEFVQQKQSGAFWLRRSRRVSDCDTDTAMSTGEVVDVAPTRSPTKPCFATCVHAGISRSHEEGYYAFSFLPFAPHFTICNKFHVGENAARNESGAFSIFF